MFQNILSKNYMAPICEITMQAFCNTLNAVETADFY